MRELARLYGANRVREVGSKHVENADIEVLHATTRGYTIEPTDATDS